MKPHRIIERARDGAYFEPSCPDDYTEGDAFADLLLGRDAYFFRRVEWRPAPWWQPWTRGEWARTGETWVPGGTGGWQVLTKPERERIERGQT